MYLGLASSECSNFYRIKICEPRTSLVIQGLGLCLPVQGWGGGVWIPSLVGKLGSLTFQAEVVIEGFEVWAPGVGKEQFHKLVLLLS